MFIEKASETILAGEFEARAARLDDLEDTVALYNVCSLATIGKPDSDIERTRTDWETPGFDLARSTRLVQSREGKLVGFVVVWDLAAVPVSPWVTGRVHPDFEGRGIGTWLLTWAETRARQAITRVPEDAQLSMTTGTVSTHEPAKTLFESRNMHVARHYWDMLIELNGQIPAAAWPDSIQVKTFAELPDIRRLYQAIDEAFQDHWGHVDQPIEQAVARWQHHIDSDENFDPKLWFLAMDGDEIAGVSLCDLHTPEDPHMGWVDVLGVRRPWRRRGLALALLHHSFAKLQQRGQKRVGLGVDSSSLTGATRLYKRAGMHVHRQFDAYEKVLRVGRDLRTKRVK